jgi:hypothetical protein
MSEKPISPLRQRMIEEWCATSSRRRATTISDKIKRPACYRV